MKMLKILLAAATLALAANANAVLTLQVSNNNGFNDYATTGTGLNTDISAVGTMTASGDTYFVDPGLLFSGWNLIVTSGVQTTNPTVLDLNVQTSGGTSSDTLFVRLTSTDLSGTTGHIITSPTGNAGAPMTVSSSIIPDGGASILLQSGTYTGALPGPSSIDVNLTGPYSLVIDAAITGGAIQSLDYKTTVPEPATLSLFGIGLLAIGFAARRKKAA